MTAAQPGMSDEPARGVNSVRRTGKVDQVIQPLGNSLGNSVGWLAENGIPFAIFAVIWAAFVVGLIWSQGSIDQAWKTILALPMLVQIVVWVLFLPVMIGLWVWETSWPLIVRLVLVVGVAGWNLLVFLPKALQAKP
jgi:hypothetical protein